MRLRRTLAATLLLALALGAPGCDWIGSLTPFGIGHQDYSGSGENVNGNWVGKTATGGDVTFQVGSNTVSQLHLNHVATGCTLSFLAETTTALVVDGRFALEYNIDTGGRFSMTGTFTSGSAATGTFLFEGLPAGICPSTGNGTFTATKTP